MTDVEAAAAKEECKQNGGSSSLPNRYCKWCREPIRFESFEQVIILHPACKMNTFTAVASPKH